MRPPGISALVPSERGRRQRRFREADLAWDPAYAPINAAFVEWAGRRIVWLAVEVLALRLFGAWSYCLQWMGADRCKQHWHYLIA